MDEKLREVLEAAGIHTEALETLYLTDALVHRLIDVIKHLAANQIIREYDEETGYCLCPCCGHGI